MYKGTTPTYRFIFPDASAFEDASEVYITFSRADGSEIFTKEGQDLEIDGKSVNVYLTQEETLAFPDGNIRAQINITYQDGARVKRACSQIITIPTKANLKDEVLS